MFDIGFWELAALGVIGLIVLGPERLPVVARTLGRWVGRARYYVNALTTELENEVGAEDIRDDVRRAREQIESETRDIRSGADRAVDQLNEPVESGDAVASTQDSGADAESGQATGTGNDEPAAKRANSHTSDDENPP